MEHIYIAGTIVFTVYGQLILKWRISDYGELPITFLEKLYFFVRVLCDPFVFSGFVSAFLASLCWMSAMTKFDLSYAYPFMSVPFVIILLLSALFFNEAVTIPKVMGLAFIIVGICIGARG